MQANRHTVAGRVAQWGYRHALHLLLTRCRLGLGSWEDGRKRHPPNRVLGVVRGSTCPPAHLLVQLVGDIGHNVSMVDILVVCEPQHLLVLRGVA